MLNVMSRLATATLVFLVCSTGSAQNAGPTPVPGKQLSSAELAPLVSYLKKFVRELTRPIHVYHYFDAGSADPVWRSKMSAGDPLGYRMVHANADGYWRAQGTEGAGNVMGKGLYFALDPVATRNYGKKDYVLIRAQLPKGARVFDLNWSVGEDYDLPPEVVKIYETLGCTWGPFGSVSSTKTISHVMEAKPLSSRICVETLRRIIDGELRADVLAYSYSSSVFKECMRTGSSGNTPYDVNPERKTAFVLMSNRWLRPELVRIFNRQTPDAADERLRIQSMYYKTLSDQANDPLMTFDFSQALAYTLIPKKYPGMTIVGTEPVAGSAVLGQVLYRICPAGVWQFNAENGCQKVSAPEVPPLPYPTTISLTNPPLYMDMIMGPMSDASPLMWNDLEGKQTDADVGAYIAKTQYGCSSEPTSKPVF